MTVQRLRREQQVERNREQLLAAARRVFLERGFHAASLDAIAEAAGFSKGVVYSQFESKADMFLALLERRIEERAAENERVVASRTGPAALAAILEAGRRSATADLEWSLLLIEFRVHAARDPALRERYARLHERTVARLAATLAGLGGSESGAAEPPEVRALFFLALGSGLTLEGAVAPHGLPSDALHAMALRALAGPEAASGARTQARRRTSATPRRERRARRTP